MLVTGMAPRIPAIPDIDHPMVVAYTKVILDSKPVRQTAAVIGTGGTGFAISELLFTEQSSIRDPKDLNAWKAKWGAADLQEGHGTLPLDAHTTHP